MERQCGVRLALVLLVMCGTVRSGGAQGAPRDSAAASRRDSARVQALGTLIVRPDQQRLGDTSLVSTQTLSTRDLARRPQPMGDLFRALSRLPGVSSTDQSARLALRGGGPEETLVLYDGMRLRDPFHLKDFDGSFSVLDESVIDAATVMVGHAPVDYGDQLGGVIAVTPKSVPIGVRTTVGAGLTGLRLSTEGAVRTGSAATPGQRSWLVSLRRSWLNIVLDAAGATDDPYTAVRPVFDDALVRLTETRVHRNGAVSRLSANALVARDGLYFRSNGDPALDSDYRTGHLWVNGSHVRGRSSSQLMLGYTRQLAERRAVGSGSLRTTTLADDRDLGAWSIRATHTVTWGAHTQWRIGSDLLFEQATAATWRRVGVGVAPRTEASGGRRSTWMALRHQLYEGLTGEVGVRAEWWPHLVGNARRHASVDPRAVLQWTMPSRTTVRASFNGMALGMGVGDRALGDADSAWYGAIHARAWSVELTQPLPGDVVLAISGYRRYEDGGRPRFVNVSGGLTPVGELEPDRQRLDVFGGRAFGVEMSARGRIGTGWVWGTSYTSARATDVRRDGGWVPRPWDLRHAASGDLSWASARGWVIAAGATWHSGWPYSRAAIQVQAPTRATAVWPSWMNGRTANYWRVDARIARTWTTRRTTWRVYADAFNLLNRFNGRGEWTRLSRVGSTWSMARFPVQLAPRIPTTGVVVTF